MSERVEFYIDAKREWRFRFVAANNEIMAEGESYKRHIDAQTAAEELFGPDVAWYDILDNGGWYEVDH